MSVFAAPTFPAWIWSDHFAESAARPYHQVVGFRRVFKVAEGLGAAWILITADARYELFINGHWVGNGPGRSWPSPWPVDEYDLRGWLVPGENTIAVLVQHFGISTFQYLHAAAGLMAQVNWQDSAGAGGQGGGEHQLVTDGSWRTCPHEGYLYPVSRVSCMQGWEEQYDARNPSHNWQMPGFDDRGWQAAKIVGRVGEGVHRAFVARTIPMLTREPVDPVRVREIQAVRAAPYTWSLNPRDLLNPQDKTANFVRGQMLLLTHIHSDSAQGVEFHQPHDRPFLEWKLNGERLEFKDFSQQQTVTGVAHAKLRSGSNTLLARLPQEEHYWWGILNVWTKRPVRWMAQDTEVKTSTAEIWRALGPFGVPGAAAPAPTGTHQALVQAERILPGATLEKMESIWAVGALAEQDAGASWVRTMAPYMVADTDIYATCASERVVGGVNVRVEKPLAWQTQSADWTTIYPNKDGSDVRVLLDFGREVVGYHEFEIDAPAGTVVDNHNFEFIQPDGRYNLAEGMNNSFRYICRAGVQRYRTLLRRGFRYSWFSFRNFREPIRIRFIRVLMSTYPQARQGSFACSDALLDQIWEAGAHSVACCSEDTYTDCPSYEQTFWVGDARNEALVDLVANGDPRLSAHAWQVAAQSLERSPLVESQVPSGWEYILPAWSFLWMRWAEEHFQLTGDTAFAKRALVSLGKNIAGIEQHLTALPGGGLFRMRANNMFDWAPMDTPSDGEITHLNCLAIIGLRQAATLAKCLRAESEAAKWSKLAERLAAAVNAHLWDAKRQAYIDCIHPEGRRSAVFSQQTQTVAFMAGVPRGKRLARCREIMRQAPRGFVQAGSPFYMFFLLEGLARLGDMKALAQVIREYWGRQVEAGATTFWESYHPGEGRMTRSHCHGWSAAPTFFLTQYMLGVRPASPGYATVLIAPSPQTVKLNWARGTVPTPRGVISCQWARSGKSFSLGVTLPADTTAVLEIPATGQVEVLAGTIKKLRGRRGVTRLEACGTEVKVSVRIRGS